MTETEKQAAAATRRLLRRIAALMTLAMPRVTIRFDLHGQAAGMVCFPPDGDPLIRYNPILLRENTDSFIATTVPHEVAHLAVWVRYRRRARPHGREWRRAMELLGAEPVRCHSFDTGRSRRRRLARSTYHCDCREHQITRIRQNRMAAGQRYYCRRCGASLRPGAMAQPPAGGGTVATKFRQYPDKEAESLRQNSGTTGD